MDIQNIIVGLVALAGFAMAGAVIYSARRPASVAAVLDATEGGLTDIEKAAGAAKEYVLAAEQLWATGRLDKENRLYFVVGKLQHLFPDMSEETIDDSIEAAVAWMKTLERKVIAETVKEG